MLVRLPLQRHASMPQRLRPADKDLVPTGAGSPLGCAPELVPQRTGALSVLAEARPQPFRLRCRGDQPTTEPGHAHRGHRRDRPAGRVAREPRDPPRRPRRRPVPASDLWITCALQFRDWRLPQWQPHHFTVLFFHDEAVSLAAGHRPCALSPTRLQRLPHRARHRVRPPAPVGEGPRPSAPSRAHRPRDAPSPGPPRQVGPAPGRHLRPRPGRARAGPRRRGRPMDHARIRRQENATRARRRRRADPDLQRRCAAGRVPAAGRPNGNGAERRSGVTEPGSGSVQGPVRVAPSSGRTLRRATVEA